MKDIDLTPFVDKQFTQRPRKLGRFSASEVYFILEKGMTPEEWLTPPSFDAKSKLLMWNGSNIHEQIQNLIEKGYEEEKREYKDKRGITLVGKCDYLPKKEDALWELKTSNKTMSSAKPWHLYQAKLYCSMFGREKGIIFQPLQNDTKLYLKNLGEVNRDDEWFHEQIDRLYVFHQKVLDVWSSNL